METERENVFLVDTKDICFLCLKHPPPSKSTGRKRGPAPKSKKTEVELEVTPFSFRTISRHLCLNIQKVFDVRKGSELNCPWPCPKEGEVDKTELSVKLCTDCNILLNRFSKLYQEQELIRLQISNCVKKVHDVMSQAGRVRSRVKNYKKMMTTKDDSTDSFHADVMENLRKQTMEKCILSLSNSIPKVKLGKKCDAKQTSGKNKKNEIGVTAKTGSDVLSGEKRAQVEQMESQPQQESSILCKNRKKKVKRSPSPVTGAAVSPVSEFETEQLEPAPEENVLVKKRKGKKFKFGKSKKKNRDRKTSTRMGGVMVPSFRRRNICGNPPKTKAERMSKTTSELKKADDVESTKNLEGSDRSSSRKRSLTSFTETVISPSEVIKKPRFSLVPILSSVAKTPLLGISNSEKEADSLPEPEVPPPVPLKKENKVKNKKKPSGPTVKTKLDSKDIALVLPSVILPVTKIKPVVSLNEVKKITKAFKPSGGGVISGSPLPTKRGRGRPRKQPKNSVQLKSVTITLPRLARTVISKYKRDTRSRPLELDKEKEKTIVATTATASSEPPTILAPAPPQPKISLFGCHFCPMKFSSAEEVRKHCSKFHYCQLFFSSLKDSAVTDDQFKTIIDTFFGTVVKKKHRGRVGCPYCKKVYLQIRYLRNHVATGHYQILKEDQTLKKLLDSVKNQKEKEKEGALATPTPGSVSKEIGSNSVTASPGSSTSTSTSLSTPHQCQYCDRSFNQKWYLRVHTAQIHSNQLFASFKSSGTDQFFSAVIEDAFDKILSLKSDPKQRSKCTLCPGLILPKGRNSGACWRLHVIDKHFQEFGGSLGPLQAQMNDESRKGRLGPSGGNCRPSTPKTNQSKSIEVSKEKIFGAGLDHSSSVPDYMQSIGNSVDKNGRRTEFYYCCLCKKTVDGLEKVENHRLTHSKTMSPPSKRNHQCRYCQMKFVSNKSFQYHSVQNHCVQLLLPYKQSFIQEEEFPPVIEQNFDNILQQSRTGKGDKEDQYRCGFCMWYVHKDKVDSMKQWRGHVVVDHFEDFTRKLIELQRDKEHASGVRTVKAVPSFRCNTCSAYFLHPSLLEEHRMNCTGGNLPNVVDISHLEELPSTSSASGISGFNFNFTMPFQGVDMLMKLDSNAGVIPIEFESTQQPQKMDITHHYEYNDNDEVKREYLVHSFDPYNTQSELTEIPVQCIFNEGPEDNGIMEQGNLPNFEGNPDPVITDIQIQTSEHLSNLANEPNDPLGSGSP